MLRQFRSSGVGLGTLVYDVMRYDTAVEVSWGGVWCVTTRYVVLRQLWRGEARFVASGLAMFCYGSFVFL